MNPVARNAAWAFVKDRASNGVIDGRLVDAAKAAPALVMANGLFQAMAYLYEKGEAQRELAEGLSKYLLGEAATFQQMAEALRNGRGDLMEWTDRALDWLEWVKLLAPALQ
jgi:CRISPR/Cas system CMR-associated protein Cmr5 small subunit